MKTLNNLFWKGLIVVLPATLSVYFFLVILNKAEGLFGDQLKKLLGPSLYIPGLGILISIILIISVGILVSNFLTGRIVKFFMDQFERVPFIKAIYNPLRDLMSLFGGSAHNKMKKVVMVKFDKLGFECLGLVTREEFSDLPSGTIEQGFVAVYIPMSYMLGGFTAILPRQAIREVDIPVERAIKLAITGWIKADKNGQ